MKSRITQLLHITALAFVAVSAYAEETQSNAAPDFSLVGYASTEGGTTGGKGGKTNPVSTASEFRDAVGATEPLNVLVSGTIDLGSNTVKVAANKTIVGVGENAGFVGHVYMHGVSNVIMRNLTFANPKGVGQGTGGGDGMTSHSSHHVWVDHCNFAECADGQFDITHGSDFFTVSWCKFSYTNAANGHRLSMLIGNKDNLAAEDAGKLHVTLHHNWIGNLVYDRAPRVRFGQVHVFNTYYGGGKGNNVCIGLGISSQVLLESAYFDGIKRPWGVRSEADTTAGQIQWNEDTVFAASKIPAGATNSTVFKPTYAYQLDAGNSVKDTVMKYAGVGQGPFAQ